MKDRDRTDAISQIEKIDSPRELADSAADRGILRWVAPGAWIAALVKLTLCLWTSAQGGYGYFRDELYYLACAEQLGWGYVDHPPLSIWILGGWRALFGDSLFALRFLPALLGAATVLVIARIAREMGGGRFAQTVSAVGATVSLIGFAFSSFYSMNAFDHLFWALAFLFFGRLLRGAQPRDWMALGLVVGFGMFNKVGMLWLAVGITVAVVASSLRSSLRTRWPWVAAGLAGLLALPYLLWNVAHDWAHLHFIGNAVSGKYSGLSIASFLSGQLLIHNPITLPLWLSGLAALAWVKRLRVDRPQLWSFLTVTAILVANGSSKSEYLGPAFALLFAAGGVAWEGWTASGRRPRLRPVLVAVVASGAVLIPMVLPILPVESFVAYSQKLGIAPSTSEGKELAELDQFYADMFGWPEKAEAVAEVFHALSQEEQERAGVYGGNYGRAGAIDLFGPALGLPKAISNHNSYWLWGPGEVDGSVLIVMGGRREGLEESFQSVEQAGVAPCDYCMPYEREMPIWVCRGPRMPIGEAWPQLRSYG